MSPHPATHQHLDRHDDRMDAIRADSSVHGSRGGPPVRGEPDVG